MRSAAGPAALLLAWTALRMAARARKIPRAGTPGASGVDTAEETAPSMGEGPSPRSGAVPPAGLVTGRGRGAEAPAQIPAAGWKDIAWRTVKEIGADDVLMVARSIAFSGMLALFPALGAFVSIYGLFADVGSARDHLAALSGVVPAEAMTLIGEQIVRIAAQESATLSFTFAAGLALSLWSANAGMKALFKGLNIAYEEEETRSFLRLNLVTLAFTLGAIVFLTLAIGGVVVAPVLLNILGLDGGGLALLRWPLLLGVVAVGLALLYRYGPSRDPAKWRWVSWGGAAAAVLWLGASALFSWYLSSFGNYNETYGSLGAVFGFMMWMWLSAVIILAGGELNAEMEHQTAVDTTRGAPQPMGARGAEMADTLGAAKTGSLFRRPGAS